MKQSFIQQLVLYRYRYVIGYVLFIAILGVLLLCHLDSIPMGLSQHEIQSTLTSATVPVSSAASPIDLPYHLLQKASLHLFGVSTIGIKLPSVVIGLISGLGVLLLLGRWFRTNVAVLGSLLAITSSLFLISSRSGDATIMLIFWPVYILLLATLVSQEVRLALLYKFLLAICVALSLYTPLMLYPLVAAIIAMIIHPHLRYILRNNNLGQIVLEFFLFLLSLAPLAWLLYNHPLDITMLFGVPNELPSLMTYARDIWAVLNNIANVTSPNISTIIVPAFSAGVLALVILGLIRTCLDHYATRSHFLLVWLALLLPISVFNSQSLVLLYVPMILLLAIGLETLIREWYKLFPRNPYARVGALLPLGLLMFSILGFNYTSYFYGFGSSPQAVSYFSTDFETLRSGLRQKDVNKTAILLITAPQEKPFFDLLRREYPTLSVIDPASAGQVFNQPSTVIIANSQQPLIVPAVQAQLGVPSTLLVDSHADDALRFRVYSR
ncbi:MAG TPA: glycosyltransferase family 39 protein [Candidatus Saccharimonadales bacterium]|jgi:hypothetical protein|nr:glycosyltransferase family 39 protein [Candidatus Saccharimonadales bacterium]